MLLPLSTAPETTTSPPSRKSVSLFALISNLRSDAANGPKPVISKETSTLPTLLSHPDSDARHILVSRSTTPAGIPTVVAVKAPLSWPQI